MVWRKQVLPFPRADEKIHKQSVHATQDNLLPKASKRCLWRLIYVFFLSMCGVAIRGLRLLDNNVKPPNLYMLFLEGEVQSVQTSFTICMSIPKFDNSTLLSWGRGSLLQSLLHACVVLVPSAFICLLCLLCLSLGQLHQRQLIEIERNHRSITAYRERKVLQWQQSMGIMGLPWRLTASARTERRILPTDRSPMESSILSCPASRLPSVRARLSPQPNTELVSDASTGMRWTLVHRSSLFSILSLITVYEGCRIKVAGGTKS